MSSDNLRPLNHKSWYMSASANRNLVLLGLIFGILAYLRLDSPWILGQWALRDIERAVDLLNGYSSSFAGSELNTGGRLPGPALYAVLALVILPFKSIDGVFYLNIFLNILSVAIISFSVMRHFSFMEAVVLALLLTVNALHSQSATYVINPSFMFVFVSIALACTFEAYFKKKPLFYVLAILVSVISTQLHLSGACLLVPIGYLAIRSRTISLRYLWVLIGGLTIVFLPFIAFQVIYNYPIIPDHFFTSEHVGTPPYLIALGVIIFCAVFVYTSKKVWRLGVTLERLKSRKWWGIIALLAAVLLSSTVFLFDEVLEYTRHSWHAYKDQSPDIHQHLVTIINFFLSIWYFVLKLIFRIVPAITLILFGDVFQGYQMSGAVGGETPFFGIDVSTVFQFLSARIYPILTMAILIYYIYLTYFGKLQATVVQRAKSIWVVSLGCLLPAWVTGYTGFTTHAWYNFVHVIPVSILFAHAGVSCIRALNERDGSVQIWRQRFARIGTTFFFLFLIFKVGNIIDLNARMKNSELKETAIPHSTGALPRYNLIKNFMANIDSEIGVTSDEFSRRLYINIYRLDQLSDVIFDFVKLGQLRNYSKIVSPKPTLFTDEKACLFIQEHRPTEGAKSHFERFKNNSTIIRETRTRHFDVFEYKPNHVDFCYSNTRAYWVANPNQLAMRKSIDFSKPVVKNIDTVRHDENGRIKNKYNSYSIYWAEQKLPWFFSLNLEVTSNNTVVADGILDSNLLGGSGPLNWDSRHKGELFENAILMIYVKDKIWELPFIKGSATSTVFGKLDGHDRDKHAWLTYFPIRLQRSTHLEIDQIRKIELKIELTDDSTKFFDAKVFELWSIKE